MLRLVAKLSDQPEKNGETKLSLDLSCRDTSEELARTEPSAIDRKLQGRQWTMASVWPS